MDLADTTTSLEKVVPKDGNGWGEYKNLVLDELGRNKEEHKVISDKLDRVLDISRLNRTDIAVLNVKAGVWGFAAGAIPTLSFIIWAVATGAI